MFYLAELFRQATFYLAELYHQIAFLLFLNKKKFQKKKLANSPEVVPLAEEEVSLGVETLTHLPQSAVAATTFKAILMPEQVHGLETH